MYFADRTAEKGKTQVTLGCALTSNGGATVSCTDTVHTAGLTGGERIDWILTSPAVVTNWSSISTYSDRGQYPSDHLPVQAALVLP